MEGDCVHIERPPCTHPKPKASCGWCLLKAEQAKVERLREALTPFVAAYEDSVARKIPCVVALAFFRHAEDALALVAAETPQRESER